MFDKFTDRARKIIALAQKEAERFRHDYIGTEHILLGLVKEGSGVAVTALNNLNVDVDKVRREVEKLVVSHEKDGPSTPLPFTPQAKKVLELASEEARALGHPYIGTEHILLGLLRENESVAAQVLINLGLKLEDVRAEILDLLGASDPTALAGSSEKTAEKPRSGPSAKNKSEESATPALDAFGRDLTQAAENGELDPVIGRSDRSSAGAPRTTRCCWVNPASARPPSSKAWPKASSTGTFPTSWPASASSPWTSPAWSPVPNTGVSSKSASRR
jgi:ATP-dependent Clp protease ATP-binding subunit ClpC